MAVSRKKSSPLSYVEVTEQKRLNEAREKGVAWKKWGPYLSERQWGTVREDYSQDGNAWNYFSHDQSRSRAYRWGEDGLAGFSDDKQRLCFALALWNGRDPILKERLFGLTSCSMSTSMATMAPAWGPATRPAGRDLSLACSMYLRV